MAVENRRQILQTLATQEKGMQSETIGENELSIVAKSVFDLYEDAFNKKGTNLSLVAMSSKLAESIFTDKIDPSIPRGSYYRDVILLANDPANVKRVDGVEFGDESVFFNKGDSDLIYPGHPLQVYLHILGHEYLHGQVVPRSVVGVNSSSLSHRDLKQDKGIHYVVGFKAVRYDIRHRSRVEITRQMEEFTAQYLWMSAHGSLEQKDPVLEEIKRHGRGITAATIQGAEVMYDIFEHVGITPQEVEAYHYSSDIKGYLRFLDNYSHRMAADFLKSGLEVSPNRSLDQLMSLEKYVKSRI